MATLLAIDLGIRTGLALYDDACRLHWYRSQNFGTISRLKRAAHGVVRDAPALQHVIIEGGGDLVRPWMREVQRRGIAGQTIHADAWRSSLLLPRNRRGKDQAKARAEDLAPEVIAWAKGSKPTSLRHDAAEAILIGLWGLVEVGWLDELPDFIR